jgi:hypothetical protein
MISPLTILFDWRSSFLLDEYLLVGNNAQRGNLSLAEKMS